MNGIQCMGEIRNYGLQTVDSNCDLFGIIGDCTSRILLQVQQLNHSIGCHWDNNISSQTCNDESIIIVMNGHMELDRCLAELRL